MKGVRGIFATLYFYFLSELFSMNMYLLPNKKKNNKTLYIQGGMGSLQAPLCCVCLLLREGVPPSSAPVEEKLLRAAVARAGSDFSSPLATIAVSRPFLSKMQISPSGNVRLPPQTSTREMRKSQRAY